MIREHTGDLLGADAEALVNAVNTVGVMGKGIALQFKRTYPQMFQDYARAAQAGEVRIGEMHVWATGATHGSSSTTRRNGTGVPRAAWPTWPQASQPSRP